MAVIHCALVEISGWWRGERVQRERGGKCEMGVNDHWVKWPKSPCKGWARVPSFLSLLMMHPCRFMGFNGICHIVQLSQSLTKTWIFTLKLKHGSILHADLGVIPSLPLLLLNKRKCMYVRYLCWCGSAAVLCKIELCMLVFFFLWG